MAIPRPRLPRRTARLRLALLYGGMFLLGATAVIAMANLVAASNNPHDPPLPPALVSQIKHIERSALDQAALNQAASDREHLLIWSGIALAAAEHDHRGRPADLRQQPARAAGPARPARRAEGTRRHPR